MPTNYHLYLCEIEHIEYHYMSIIALMIEYQF